LLEKLPNLSLFLYFIHLFINVSIDCIIVIII